MSFFNGWFGGSNKDTNKSTAAVPDAIKSVPEMVEYTVQDAPEVRYVKELVEEKINPFAVTQDVVTQDVVTQDVVTQDVVTQDFVYSAASLLDDSSTNNEIVESKVVDSVKDTHLDTQGASDVLSSLQGVYEFALQGKKGITPFPLYYLRELMHSKEADVSAVSGDEVEDFMLSNNIDGVDTAALSSDIDGVDTTALSNNIDGVDTAALSSDIDGVDIATCPHANECTGVDDRDPLHYLLGHDSDTDTLAPSLFYQEHTDAVSLHDHRDWIYSVPSGCKELPANLMRLSDSVLSLTDDISKGMVIDREVLDKLAHPIYGRAGDIINVGAYVDTSVPASVSMTKLHMYFQPHHGQVMLLNGDSNVGLVSVHASQSGGHVSEERIIAPHDQAADLYNVVHDVYYKFSTDAPVGHTSTISFVFDDMGSMIAGVYVYEIDVVTVA